MNIETWFGYLAPPTTPDNIVLAQAEAISKIVLQPSTQAKIAELGYAPAKMDPQAFARVLPEEHARWAEFVRAQGIKAE